MIWILKRLIEPHPNWFLTKNYFDHYENLKSVWTSVLVVLILWVMSLFLRHISDAYLLQREQGGRISEERRQMLEAPIVRSRTVTWGDRFKRGAVMSRGSFLMLLATVIAASLPIQYRCKPHEINVYMNDPAALLSDKILYSPLRQQDADDADVHTLSKRNVGIPIHSDLGHLYDNDLDEESEEIDEDYTELPHRYYPDPDPFPHKNESPSSGYPRKPYPPHLKEPISPSPPSPPHKRPAPPLPPHPPHEQPPITPPSPPVPPHIGGKTCYSNSVTDAVLILSWIFVGLNLLWYALELSLVDPKSSAITRSVMGTFSYPLLLAAFIVVFTQWRDLSMP